MVQPFFNRSLCGDEIAWCLRRIKAKITCFVLSLLILIIGFVKVTDTVIRHIKWDLNRAIHLHDHTLLLTNDSYKTSHQNHHL